MLGIYFVDDDPFIIEELKSLIDYKSYGYVIVGANTDPLVAKEEILNLKPHLVITDVQMKKMNGLQMAEELRNQLDDTTFVFLSVFDKFDYAVEAMRLGAIRYLKKPVIKQELIDCLEQVKYKKIASFNNEVLLSFTRESDEMKKLFQSSCLLDHNSSYRIVYLNGGNHEAILGKMNNYCSSFLILYNDPIMTSLIAFNLNLNTFKKSMIDEHNDVSTSVSPLFEKGNYDDIQEWYRRIRIGSKEKFITGKNEFIVVDNKDSSSELCNKILECSQVYTFQDIVNNLKSHIENYHVHVYDLQKVYRAILINMLRLKIIEYDENLFDNSVLDAYDSLKEMIDDLSYFFVSNFDCDMNETIIKEVKSELENNISKKLTLAYFAKKYSYNISYFSQLFKKSVGVSFVEFFTSLKMDRAKHLIVNTSDSFQSIAIDVGYGDYYHFSKIFKKYTSYTPTEFRTLFTKRVS